jgi:O-methyltransferase
MLKAIIKKSLFNLGYSISKIQENNLFPIELSKIEIDIINYVRANNLSMCSTQNLYSTALSCKYVVDRNIEGDFVECGVYRGGNAIIAAHIFKAYGIHKKVFLFDTFKGMTEPTKFDSKTGSQINASHKYARTKKSSDFSKWAYASLSEVKENFKKLNLENNIQFIIGDVLETLNTTSNIPSQISILRLDTDWYESTIKELECLYKNLVPNGILIVDDYGSWTGVKKAVDEYFSGNIQKPFFSFIDSAARIAIKPL